jgi:hypothetical protein
VDEKTRNMKSWEGWHQGFAFVYSQHLTNHCTAALLTR